jgi:hypothetical protein
MALYGKSNPGDPPWWDQYSRYVNDYARLHTGRFSVPFDPRAGTAGALAFLDHVNRNTLGFGAGAVLNPIDVIVGTNMLDQVDKMMDVPNSVYGNPTGIINNYSNPSSDPRSVWNEERRLLGLNPVATSTKNTAANAAIKASLKRR